MAQETTIKEIKHTRQSIDLVMSKALALIEAWQRMARGVLPESADLCQMAAAAEHHRLLLDLALKLQARRELTDEGIADGVKGFALGTLRRLEGASEKRVLEFCQHVTKDQK